VIKLVCVGRLKEDYLAKAAAEYLKRIGWYGRIEVVELRECAERNVEVAKREEGKHILGKIGGLEDYFKVVLDSGGKQFSSEEFSRLLGKQNLFFVIGGPNGVSEDVLSEADLVLSLSKMTFTHQMVRVFLLEQVYRGYTILSKESYHK